MALTIDVTDPSGVKENSVVITVAVGASPADTIWQSDGEVVPASYAVTKNILALGFRYQIQPLIALPPSTLITFSITSEDNAGNISINTVLFTTSFSLAEIRNQDPASGATSVPVNTDVELSIIGIDTFVVGNSINIYIDGILAYDGYNFQTNFDGYNSSFSTTNIDGYDGYKIVIDKTSNFSSFVFAEIHVVAEDGVNNTLDEYYSFKTEPSFFPLTSPTNNLYFSDGYGMKKIDLSDLVGESQTVSTDVPFTLAGDDIIHISGNRVDNYDVLTACYASDNYGCSLIINEDTVFIFADAYDTDKAEINDEGTLYLINKTSNQIEVYYGALTRPPPRSPDFIYSSSSTPSIFAGTILTLHISSGESLIVSGGTRLYIGTSLGMTVIDAHDLSTNGFSAGLETNGASRHFSISGGGATYEQIGGTVPNVVNIAADENNAIMLVATTDNAGNGGITQISLSGNRKILFMNRELGYLPSNNVRSIYV